MDDRLGVSSGGALIAAATQFLETHPGAPPSCPAGVDGLAALANAIDHWAERPDVPPHQDESFHEGAGALLGLLLLERLGGAHVTDGERHAVRVGAFGFFDPFAAVERAMEADEARDALVIEVDRAEQEAAAAVGVGRAVRLLTARLGEARIDAVFGPQVTLDDGVELDLSQAVRATEGEPERAADKAIQKLVSMLPGHGGAALSWAEAIERLLPRLVQPGFTEERGAGLVCRPVFDARLELTFVLSYEGRARYVHGADLESWSQDVDTLTRQAVENLAARSEGARFGRVDTEAGALVVARTGDGLDGARLLLPSLHEVLSEELGSPFLCAVPHRDALLACPADKRIVETLRARAAKDFKRAPHPASPSLFEVSERGVRAV
ncbi:MAG: hypothetical protein AB8I08_23970 [Sandaracinaceae bacterium]